MSRIGKNPVPVPANVEIGIDGQNVTVKGPKGELKRSVHSDIRVTEENGEDGKVVWVRPKSQDRKAVALWPTWRTLVNNMVTGVSEGFTTTLEIHGVGYRAQLQGQDLILQLGYSHDINYPVPNDISVNIEKQTVVSISGIDKERIGQMAAEIYAMRPPEPYKGKGVRYQGQYIFRKEGKKK